ncbi:MAG: prephenate dehydrogenase/arogenate dehydrogenase family protein [Desulfomonile sp.]|nr:prephenate dehydrogenase/arogenate dehydrogenase family protein [Desulfomonile sp.]
MRLAEAVVTIVGMGLMGGSLGMALVKGHACKEVRALTRRPSNAEEIVKAKAAHKAGTNPELLLSDADLVVFAAPVRTIQRQIWALHAFMKPGAVVTEMGSTKGGIVGAFDRLPAEISAVGGHPMCGKEVSGLAAADPDLFQNKVWALTPSAKSTAAAFRLVEEMVLAVGAIPMSMSPDRHDRAVACISHLVYLMATVLVAVAEDTANDLPEVWQLAASGFRDSTRVAAGNIVMMMDILATNRENVLEMLGKARRQMTVLSRLLEEEDESGLLELLTPLRHRRLGMFPLDLAAEKAVIPNAP